MKKMCSGCKKIKNCDRFHKSKNFKDGHKSKCKECRAVISKKYRTENKDKVAKALKRCYIKSRESGKFLTPKWKAKCKFFYTRWWSNICKKEPWQKYYYSARRRCVVDKNNWYYKKGIKLLMTREDFKTLWFRDKAYLMKKPSIDRINPKGNYEYINCRFVEFLENVSCAKTKWK